MSVRLLMAGILACSFTAAAQADPCDDLEIDQFVEPAYR